MRLYKFTTPYTQNELNGIVRYANNQKKYPISHFVTGFASSFISSPMDQNVVFNFSSSNHWESSNNPNQYFIVCFPFSYISILGYGITTNSIGNSDFPRSWDLKASNDNYNWELVHYQEDAAVFNALNETKTFQVTHPGQFRYFKITMYGRNNARSYYLCFQNIDIFGTFYNSNAYRDWSQNTYNPHFIYCTILSLIFVIQGK